MIGTWLSGHWLDVLTAAGIITGLVLSIYNFIIHKKTTGRRLEVKITYGQFRDAPEGLRCQPMLFIDVANVGYCPVTVEEPFFIITDGKALTPSEIVSDVRYPHELNTCKRISLAAREADIRNFYGASCGYIGEVQIYGAIKDQTGKVWRSKKPWRLGLRDGKQSERGHGLEWEAISKCESNYRDYKDASGVFIGQSSHPVY